MTSLIRFTLAVTALVLPTGSARAHYNMLLPQTASPKVGDEAVLLYQWGHPFEHQLFDAPRPASIVAISPTGKRLDLTKALTATKVSAEGGKQVIAYELRFTPDERGDYIFVLSTPPIWMEQEKEFLQDTVKAVVHVQAEKGWDQAAQQLMELVPLTRPYALQPGMVFRAQALAHGRPLGRSIVEIERYNASPPKELPPDEHRTYTARTDPNGIATSTLPDPGWWCITVQGTEIMQARDGKMYSLRQRTSLWVQVDEKPSPGK